MSVIISTPASRGVFTISDTTPDSTAVFPFFMLLIDSLTNAFVYLVRYAGNCICLEQTIPVPCKLYVNLN